MLAYHSGVEVECKIAEAISPRHYQDGFHSTGTCGVFGAAAAAPSCAASTWQRPLRALGIAASQAAGLRENFGTMTKPFHAGRAAEAGVVAADLAALGWTADRPYPGSAARLLPRRRRRLRPRRDRGQLGNPWTFASPGVSIKPLPSGSLTHPGMTEMLRLIREHEIKAAGRGTRRCRHQQQHAQRADPSPARRRAAGQVQHGILHGGPAALRQGGPGANSPTRWCNRPEVQAMIGADPFRRRSGSGSGGVRQDDHHHRHPPERRPHDFAAAPISPRAARPIR